ncbi:hypothetical protein KRMM14A1259_06250 [Krasilnikovia sp. MM14-A1259]
MHSLLQSRKGMDGMPKAGNPVNVRTLCGEVFAFRKGVSFRGRAVAGRGVVEPGVIADRPA